MVLEELGVKIRTALGKIHNQILIDKEVINQLLKEIGNALIASDVDINLVVKLRKTILEKIDLHQINKRRHIEKVVFDELVSLVNVKGEKFVPKKGQVNVIMFVGLQGSGKTTTLTKLAYFYEKLGYSTGLVCADTFRPGAYDQLKQNAGPLGIPYYGSYNQYDPVQIIIDGVNKFKENKTEIILIDTSGRHKQELALFEEMKQMAASIKPHQIVFIMDATIGQNAYAQTLAFKQSINVGAVIITKLDGNSKAGGAISAVAATNAPITFYSMGEHIDDLEIFDAKQFIRNLLNIKNIQDLTIPKDVQKSLLSSLNSATFTLKDLYDQLQTVSKNQFITNIIKKIPTINLQKMKKYISIMDSMTKTELIYPDVLDKKSKTRISRLHRISRGSGQTISDVNDLLNHYYLLKSSIKTMKGQKKSSLSSSLPHFLM